MAKRKRGTGQVAAARDPSAIDPAAAKLKFSSYKDLADAEDDFHINRDKIALGEDRQSKRSKQDADEPLELSDEEVLGYSDGASDEDEDNNDDQDDDIDASDGMQSGQEEEEDDDDDTTNWGSSKADYYNADAIETEQDALDEEAEARRIQQKRLRSLQEADFGFDESAWVDDGKDDEGKEHGSIVTEVLPQLQVTDDMTPAQRLKLLQARYPEFEPLANEMVDLQPLHTQLAEAVRSQQTSESGKPHRFSASTLKYNALSGYLGALAMYFAILTSTAGKGEANSLPLAPNELRQHEIMDTLVRCRDLWESVKDLPDYATVGSESPSFSPSVSAAAEQEEQQPESEIEESTKHQQAKPLTTASEARRAARLARTEESLAALTSTIKARQRNGRSATKAANPSEATVIGATTAADLDSDIGDEPALTPAEAAAAAASGRRKKSLKFYTSQLAQKASKRANAGRGAGGDEDVPHRERLRDRQERLNREAEKRAQKGGGKGADLGSDEEDDKGPEETNRQREARLDDDDEMDEAARALEERVRAKKATKLQRRRDGQEGGSTGNQRHLVEQIANADGRRDIGYVIDKNKGLTPRRKKEVRNPRVKKRMRFEDKKKKLRSMKATYKGGEGRGGYGGELTGIKKGLVRSVKL